MRFRRTMAAVVLAAAAWFTVSAAVPASAGALCVGAGVNDIGVGVCIPD